MEAEVLVFKTDIRTKLSRLKLGSLFKNQPHILSWNVDLEDCDKVLRIMTDQLSPKEIVELVESKGFAIQELS